MIQYKRVLVPTDFSDHAKVALDYAVQLPFADDGELILVHAIEPTVYPIHRVIKQTDYLSLEKQVHETCQEHLDELAKAIEGPAVRTVLRDGHGFAEICGTAEEENADLIVIATHGRSGLTHLVMGSTAERVVRKAPCPVLTVRIDSV